MSQENVEAVRAAYEHYEVTGETLDTFMAAYIVWDMSNYAGWVDRKLYYGSDSAAELVADWTQVWGEWHPEIDALVDAGDKVIAIIRQRSRSELTNLPVVTTIAQVWTLRDTTAVRMEGYATPGEALRACGLAT